MIPARLTVCRAESSAIDRSESALSVGVAFTNTSNVRLNVALSPAVLRLPSRPPSSTVTVIVAVPLWSATGVNAMLPVAFADVYVTAGLGISPVLLLLAVTRSGCDSPPPAVIPARLTVCRAASSSIDRFDSASRVGASFTAFTVTSNVRLNVALSPVVSRSPSRPPSSTVIVIVAVPL